MKSETEWIATLPGIWEIVAPDACKQGHYIIRCTACGVVALKSDIEALERLYSLPDPPR